MTPARELYLSVADTAASLLAAPEVAERWREPSALAKLSVQGLAGHLATQIFLIPAMVAEPEPAEPAVSIHEYYLRSDWVGSDIDIPLNRAMRTGGEEVAADGPAALAARAAACVDELRATLPGTPDRRVRRPVWGPWSLSLDAFITSRVLELVVHSDDLAYSVGVPTPEFPAAAVETVVDLLSRIAVRRHGATDVLRALSRSERAPASISAL